MTKMILGLASALAVAGIVAGCATEAKTLDPKQIESQYGASGRYTGQRPHARRADGRHDHPHHPGLWLVLVSW